MSTASKHPLSTATAPRAAAIIVAGGSGKRMRQARPKQYLMLGDRPILAHTLCVFGRCDRIDRIVAVIPESDHDYCRTHIVPHLSPERPVSLVSGGVERQDSVRRGLESLDSDVDVVVIHDGVRPFVSTDLIGRCIDAAGKHGACVLGLPAVETLKTETNGWVGQTIDRTAIWQIQTPQAFKLPLIREAHARASADGFVGTDDASLVERMGAPVRILRGSHTNLKITRPEDLELAALLLAIKNRPMV